MVEGGSRVFVLVLVAATHVAMPRGFVLVGFGVLKVLVRLGVCMIG